MSYKYQNNLFNWATSELSQDAFFCWLLSWLEKPNITLENSKLREVAFKFLEKLTNKDLDIHKVEGHIKVHRQKNHVDIAIKLNKYQYWILIEDKVHGKDSKSKQRKYAETFLKNDPGYEVIQSYIKTGTIDSSDYNLDIPLIGIDELNELFASYNLNNQIYLDFKNYIKQKIEERETIKKELFETKRYDGLKFHIGQSLFFDQLLNEGFLGIDNRKCYKKVGVSRGGQQWTELWLTNHKEKWDYEDAIFYRLEYRNKTTHLSLRQYNNRFNKAKPTELKPKQERYERLRSLFKKNVSGLNIMTYEISPSNTSSRYYSSIFGAFVFENNRGNMGEFITNLIAFNKLMTPEIKKIISIVH